MADSLDLAMRAVAHPVCWAILLNGADDLFIDLTYYFRGLFKEERRRIQLQDLDAVERQHIAIMVPTWQEAPVIQQMLEHNLDMLAYPRDRYDIFVGTYCNDEATQEKVDEVERRFKNVHKVVTPTEGPSCKADNLNWIYQGIQVVEERRGRRFDILLMHDAEDLIHPLALKLYNYLIPRHDFVQTPVFPLERRLRDLVGATYMDEFTEHHLKDMLVREAIGGLVPSAGVGSAFARDSFEEIAFAHSQKAFNTESLTEDYEIGTKFCLAGKKVFFASQAILTDKVVQRGIFRRREIQIQDEEYIATREFFPDNFRDAVRQRSRWVLGIALQGWEQIGWKGRAPVLYCLWRDRKALLTNYLTMLAYGVALYCLLRLIFGAASGNVWTFDHIFPPGSVLWWLVMANTVILGWRVFMKFATVDRIYGTLHGMMSVPRFLVANVINFFATSRALLQFAHYKWTGEPVRWDKTSHAFPSPEVLRAYQRRLGELLLDRQGITEDHLVEALHLQGQSGMKLGQVVAMTGVATLHDISSALGDQLEMPVAVMDPYAVPLALLRLLPEAEAEEMGVIPLSMDLTGTVSFATFAPPEATVRSRLEEAFQTRVAFEFASEGVLTSVRQRAYRRLVSEQAQAGRPQRLGEILVERGLLDADQLESALMEQAGTREPLGELLLRKGLMDAAVLSPIMAARVHEPFHSVTLDGVSKLALQRIGYGPCSLHAMVPLSPEKPGSPLPLASASPVHDEVRATVVRRLGVEVLPVLAPSLDVRTALAVACRDVWPLGLAQGVGGLDGAELAAVDEYPGWQGDLRELIKDCRAAACSPVDYLVRTRTISRGMGARLRAQSLGVSLAGPSRMDEEEARGWLPPGWASRTDIQLLDASRSSMTVAAPRPTPRLNRELIALFPDVALCWRVAPFRTSPRPQEGRDTMTPSAGNAAEGEG